ncbi:MAG: nicotinamide riboside transporter PnuC [Bacteroidales bacterium]|nr:nicotinamide riboside transporter PnuC [Bacteroidales bacterium]
MFEITGVIVSIASLVLEYRASRWFWLFSIVASLMYVYINFSSGIYANGAVQVYYFAASLYGAIYWLRTRDKSAAGSEEKNLASMPAKFWPWVIGLSAVLTVIIANVLRVLGESEVCWLDGLSSALGIVAMVLTARKYYQSWLLWMAVEPLMIVMYFINGNYPSSAMYVVYLAFAIMGYFRWKKLALTNKEQ